MKTQSCFVLISIAVCLCLAGCQPAKHEGLPDVGITRSEKDSMIMVNQGGFEFSILLPRDLLSAHKAEINYNETTGLLEVGIGPGFMFTISREAADLVSLRKELSEELFYKNQITQEDGRSLLYQRALPDGKAYFYQYITNLEIGANPFHARTISEGEFTLDQVEKIKAAIQTISAP
jgi:hypothetical protein